MRVEASHIPTLFYCQQLGHGKHKENIKADAFYGEFTGYLWIPLTRGQY